MATTEMNCLAGGGGGNAVFGDKVKVNGTETSSVTTTNTDFVVETGLSSIKHFLLMFKTPTTNYYMSLIYSPDYFGNKSVSDLVNKSSANAQAYNNAVGADAQTVPVVIRSVSGGTITLRTANDYSYGANITDIQWVAC